MSRTALRRLTLLVLTIVAAIAAGVALPASIALAHNTLVSSDPADGSTLTVAPAQVTWTFSKAVPLDTMTVTLIDVAGNRSDLAGSTHGAAGDTQVVTPLPALQPGPVELRWRLVGPDGHPITGRVGFTIATPAPTTAAPATTIPVAATTPAIVAPTPTTTLPSAADGASADVGDGSFSTPSFVRWILRYASYVAIMAIVGILLTSAYVWSGAGSHPLLTRILSGALMATAGLGFLQLLVVASDVSGRSPWASFGSIDAATTTDAGMALMIRVVLALTMWVLLFRYQLTASEVHSTAVSFAGLGLLGTWAFAGHSRSMRWPTVGVLTDIAHHAAAAAWIAGLAIVAWIVIPTSAPTLLVSTVRRFSRVAATCVVVLVATGLVQSLRLVGNPADLFGASHGRLLAAKVVLLVVMLAVANANRRRVDTRLNDDEHLAHHAGALRQAVLAEFAIGVVIIGITAAMVVSPPATNQTDTGERGGAEPTAIYYTM